VHGARGLTRRLKLRVKGVLVDAPTARPVPVAARSHRRLWITGLVTSLVLAGFVSFYASSSPDGLMKVAHDQGIDKTEKQHAASDSPLAGYGVKDVADARLSGGLAGVIGVGATVAAGSGVFWAVRRRRTADTAPAGTAAPTAGTGV
jgi:cobalt/nickel transport system permease protein